MFRLRRIPKVKHRAMRCNRWWAVKDAAHRVPSRDESSTVDTSKPFLALALVPNSIAGVIALPTILAWAVNNARILERAVLATPT